MTAAGRGRWHALARRVHRRWRRWHARRSGPGITTVYHPRYQRNVWGVPLDPLRGEKILAALEDVGLVTGNTLSEPRPASLQNLLRVHRPEYLQSLQDGQALARILGVEVPEREAETTLDLQRLMVGGTIQATRLALRGGGVVAHLGGGFHHALPEAGMGFCVFNDVAVAIARLRGRGFAGRVLVVDLDLHDGNGTRRIFADDPTVYTFSIHNQDWGEREALASTAIALGRGVNDALYLGTIMASLPPVFASFRPELVVYVAGTDPAEDDALGDWRISAQGLLVRDRFVTDLVRRGERPLPMVIVLAGGYGDAAWRYSARFLTWLATGRVLEPPEEDELTLKRFRRISDAVRAAERSAEGDDLPFSLSAEDLAGIEPGLRPPSRYLGYFTRHGVELLLERFGILDQLRAKGFRTLRLDLDANEPLGQTLHVVSEDGPRELLLELRVNRRPELLPGLEVLAIEWLLLQNPRAAFSARRPRLPGQQHPGLGLLREILGWLVVVCETHGLDGLYFVAAHYHIAVQSRRLVRCLRPEDEARVQAFAAALAGLPLAEAVEALAEGRLVSEPTGEPVAWEPAPMVLPVSERLKQLVSGPDYEQRVEGERSRLALKLRPAASGPSAA